MNKQADGAEMSLFEHLGELRRRLVISFLAIFAAAILAFMFSGQIVALLSEPYYLAFPKDSLIGTGPQEAFLLKFKVAFFSGILLACPIIFYQLWLFIAPGLYPEERNYVFPFVGATSLLFLGGVWFCYSVVFPVAFPFFHDEYVSLGLTPAIRLSEHLSLVIMSLLGFGVVFEMPMLAFLLAKLGLITDKTLIRNFRYAIVIIFVVAAVFTPPDVISQFLMAVPLLVLYGVSILIARTVNPEESSKEEESTTLQK